MHVIKAILAVIGTITLLFTAVLCIAVALAGGESNMDPDMDPDMD